MANSRHFSVICAFEIVDAVSFTEVLKAWFNKVQRERRIKLSVTSKSISLLKIAVAGMGWLIIKHLNIEDVIDVKATVDYVLKRQNEDGGYTFCREAESNAQDTFYAIEILSLLNTEPRNTYKTIAFMKRLQHRDKSFDSVKVAYYVVSVLSELRAAPIELIDETTVNLEAIIGGLDDSLVYVEAVSELEHTYFAIKLLDILGISMDTARGAQRILKRRNTDGSFGSRKFSSIASTFYALSSLRLLGHDLNTLTDTLAWVRHCEMPTGGFTAEPEMSSPYMVMEDIYFGLKSLETLRRTCRFPNENLRLVAKFQNFNGGFRRSIFLGISEFESTYQALSSIKLLFASS